jgi:hypothetical protein
MSLRQQTQNTEIIHKNISRRRERERGRESEKNKIKLVDRSSCSKQQQILFFIYMSQWVILAFFVIKKLYFSLSLNKLFNI